MMANVFRISVVLAIVYLARYILARELQAEEDQLYFDDFQREESWIAIDDSNENTLILSEDSFEEDDRDVQSNEKVLIQSDDPFHGSQAAWFEEEYFLESNEDNMPDKNIPFEFEISWPKEDKYAESNEYYPSNENMVKSGDPVRGRTIHQRAWTEEEKIVELNENNPSNDKVPLKSGVPFRGRTIHHKAWSEEGKTGEWNKNNPSNEKVLIQSGAPLRGRTIHHTAWSEEEKIVVSKEDAKEENVKKNIYDSWDLTKAFNYILSFIYDVEDDGAIVQSTVEDRKQILKSKKGDLREIVLPPSRNKLEEQKKTPGNLTTHNQDKYSSRGSISTYSAHKDMKRLKSVGGEFDNGDDYVDFEFVEKLFEDKDYDQEEEFWNLFDDGKRFGALQENPRKNIHPNLLKDAENYFQKNSKNENLPKIKDREHVQPGQVSEENEKVVKVQETRNEAVVINEQTRGIEKPAAEEQSKVISKPSVNSNKKLKEEAVGNFASIEDKQSNEDFFSQVENKNGEVLPGEKSFSQLKLTENDQDIYNETPKSTVELDSYIIHGTPVNYDGTELSQDKLKNSDFHTASNKINNKIKEDANFDVESSVETTTTQIPQPSFPATESTQTTHDVIRKDAFIKTKTLDPSTQKHFQLVSSTLTTESLNKHKEQSFDFDQQVKNNHITLPVESNQERNHEINTGHTIARSKNEDPKPSSNVAGDTIVNTDQLQGKRNYETNVAQFQNVKSPRKLPKENGAEHSKTKTDSLRDLYPDFEVQENVASYNYMLDSGEFIRVDGNNQNKVHKNKNNSTLLPVKDKKEDMSGKMTPILSKKAEPFDDQSKPENFETILEYLYKHSNSTLLLSLREFNSSES